MITATRYHDISCGHRVAGHESKCRHLHGHNYRITFTAASESLDKLGRVVDFSVLKSTLCAWLEREWDHKFLVWEKDPMTYALQQLATDWNMECGHTLVLVPYNPTAENMALDLLHRVAPSLLQAHGIYITEVVVEETRKCSATASLR